MTRVLFLQDMMFEFLGIEQLGAVLKKAGHECELYITSEDLDYAKKIKEYNPDFIAFSTATGHHHIVLAMAKEIKEDILPTTLIVVGGAHPTFYPKFIEEDNIDIICVGEGDYAFLDLANAIQEGKDYTKIKNLWVKKDGRIYSNEMRPLIENLDELPFPDRSLYDKYPLITQIPTRRFLTNRGCPYKCTYCFNHKLAKMYMNNGDKAKYSRKRSPENLVEEIKLTTAKYKTKLIKFPDDTFTYDREWLLGFLKLYEKEVKIPFTCLGRANELDEEVVIHLKNAGCVNFFFGLESGNDYIRNTLLKRHMSKEVIIKAGELLKKYKIKFGTYNMFGLPYEDLDKAFETIELNQKIGVDYPFSTIFQPYPGTELGDWAKDNGYLEGIESPNAIAVMNEKSIMQNKDINQLVNINRLFFLFVKFPSLTPVLKVMIKAKPNKAYKMIYDAAAAYSLVSSFGLNFFTSMRLGMKLRNKL